MDWPLGADACDLVRVMAGDRVDCRSAHSVRRRARDGREQALVPLARLPDPPHTA
jgi:hypothetical protein